MLNNTRISRRRLLTAMALSPLLLKMNTARAAAVDPHRIVALEWLPVGLMMALGVTPYGVADIPNYNLWVNEPKLPDSVIDVGLRTEPNLELLTQMKYEHIMPSLADQPVMAGGPVSTDRGFVLHPSGQSYQATVDLEGDLSLSTSQDVLFAIADGVGPAKSLIALGYVGWEAGQLEAELAQNAWLTVPAEPFILFDLPCEERLPSAMEMLGIDFIHLTGQAGHA